MFDHLAIHIADVEAAVGRVGEIDHTDPGVAAGGKLEALFVGRAFAREIDAIGGGRDHLAVDELAAGVACEAVILEGWPVGIAAINRGARRAGEITAHATAAFDGARDRAGDTPARAHDAPRLIGTDAEDLGRTAVFGDTGPRSGQGKERILGGTGAIMDPVLEMIRVRAGELTAEVIVAHPVLGAAGFESEGMRLRVEPEIVTAEFAGREVRSQQAGDLAAVAAAGEEVDALVWAPLHAVGHPLDVDDLHARPETREDLLAVIGDTLAGAIFEAPDVRRREHVKSAVGPDQSRGPRQIIGEDATRLVVAIAIFVFEDRDAAKVRDLVAPFRVVDHLADEHPAAFVVADGDRVANLRFVGGELKFEAWLHLPGRDGLSRFDGRVARKLLGGIDRRCAFGLPIGLLVGCRGLDAIGREQDDAGTGKAEG